MTTTSNPAAIVDDETFTVRRTIRIQAPIEKVWAAITEPELISRWFGRADFDGSGPGARGTLTWDDSGSYPVRVEAVDAPRSISYRWGNDGAAGTPPAEIDDAHSTVFTFTLEEAAEATQLTVVETGFETTSDSAANLDDHREGWDSELDELVALLEDAA